jgi:rRNA-processing protein FCF1
MLLLVSDANILIDMDEGGLLASMFSLDCRFIIPDILFSEELEERHAHFLELGLEQRSLSSEAMIATMQLAQVHTRTSRNDLFALSLAKQEMCALLTGDKHLKEAAEKENVVVHGTIWLVEELVLTGKISVRIAYSAYEKMERSGRRLPWKTAKDRLKRL